jgi:putative phosphoesterase
VRVGIFSDIHGNIDALEKVWQALKEESCDRYVFLGDICGYYYYQNEAIALLKACPNLICLLGNHDEMFLRMLHDPAFEEAYLEKYGMANSLFKKSVTPENMAFLTGLGSRREIKELNMLLCHGSPWDPVNEYVYPTASLQRFESLPYHFVLLGHTHHPMDQKAGGVRIINPGSCGQPRDYNWPSYAVLDVPQERVEIKRVDYDRSRLIADVVTRGEKNPYLIEVLKREKKENHSVR